MDSLLTLESLTDVQKLWLSQIAYVNFTEEGRDLVSSGGMKVLDLINYIEADDSSKHIYDKLIEVGLGELTIVDVSRERKWYTNGFQALTVKDEHNNAGIVYRGSDFEWNRGALDDWFNANLGELFNNTSEQAWYAKQYFLKNKSEEGTYLFGHSLGGNLSSHVFAEYYDQIDNVFVYNPNFIHEIFLNEEQVKAFSDPEKFNCYITCGDAVSHFKTHNRYKNTVKYVHNVNYETGNSLDAHSPDAASIDPNGSFNEVDSEEILIESHQVYKNSFDQVCVAVENFFRSMIEQDKKDMINESELFKKSFEYAYARFNYGNLPVIDFSNQNTYSNLSM